MKLRYISLHFEDRVSLDNNLFDFSYLFNFNREFINDFLSKSIRKLNIETEGFNLIQTRLVQELPEKECKVSEVFKSLTVFIKFDKDNQDEYQSLTCWVERYEFMLNLIKSGLMIASKYYDIQIQKIIEIINIFREKNYKNEWLFAKKVLREHDLYLFLKCYFTHCDFRLELEAYNVKKTKLLTKGIVLQTLPSDLCFKHEFKKIAICFNKIIILDFINKPNFEIDMNLLSKGIFNVKEIEYDYEKEWEEQFKKEGIAKPPKEEAIKFLDQL